MAVNIHDLNPPQQEACRQISGPLLVLAGAGTGKTRVITYRIAHMLDRGIDPTSIAAMTFTNKAAREMADRLRSLVGPERSQKIRIGTFHNFCLRILREHGEKIGIARGFSLAPTSDQIDLLTRATKDETRLSAANVESLHAAISRAKNDLLSPQEFAQSAIHNASMALSLDDYALAYELYERQLRLNRMIDFDDCICKTVKLLENHPDVKVSVEQKYSYFLVDEFQDTNKGQLRVLELVASKSQNICVVGDDDQSIYSWRGAMYETLEKFEAIFPGTKLIKLEQNYRCTNTILKAANHVIKNNERRKDKALWSKSEAEYPLSLFKAENEEAEARDVALKIMSLVGEGYRPSDIAILYRANAQARMLELALREVRIPYETFGGSSFFERKEVKDFLAYVRLITEPEDRLAFWRVVNTPHRGIGLRSLEKIEASSVSSGQPPFVQAQSQGPQLGLTAKSLHALNQFTSEIQELSRFSLSQPEDFENFGQEIIKRFKLATDIRDSTKDNASRERKLDALRALPGWLCQCARDILAETKTLDAKALLDKLTLNERDVSEKDQEGKKNCVSLMTIHASKGLEFKAVFLVGLEEELFPHKNSVTSNEGLCEERRLFYVALTRAKAKLHLSFALERGSGSMRSLRQPSRFLKELPKDILDTDFDPHSMKAASFEQKLTKTISSFASLRQSLRT
jgi:DNA helicase-2/ATP-dependent DNA helicase PcrA